MMIDINKYLQALKYELLLTDNFKPIELTRNWAKDFPSKPGVYALKHNSNVVYVGETGNLKKRMIDLTDSRHHCVRRTLGHLNFFNHDGYTKATTKLKFPQEIEELLNAHIINNFKIAYLIVALGRKELEEDIEASIDTLIKLNKRGKRKE